MLLTIDIGNTNIVFAIFRQNMVKCLWRFTNNSDITIDEFTIKIHTALEYHKIRKSEIKDIIIANVVPNMTRVISDAIKGYFSKEAIFVTDCIKKLPIILKVDNPYEVGEDRIANAIAGFCKYQKGTIIVDFGTATTFDIISDKGEYLGGIIAPGVQLSINALSSAAARLPSVGFVKPDKIVGSNTITAMQSGMFYGYLSLVEGIIDKLLAEYDFNVVVTGGLGEIIQKNSKKLDVYDAELTLSGLKLLYDYIKKH